MSQPPTRTLTESARRPSGMDAGLMRIMAVSVSATALNHLKRFEAVWNNAGHPSRLRLTLHYIGSSTFDQKVWPGIFDAVEDQDIILLDLMGAPSDFCGALMKRLEAFPGQLVILGSSGMGLNNQTRLGHFNPAAIQKARQGSGPGMGMGDAPGPMDMDRDKLSPKVARDLTNYTWLVNYWHYASQDNMQNLVFLLGRDYMGLMDMPAPAEPQTLDEMTI